MRGLGNSDRKIGTTQEDAIRNITARITTMIGEASEGAFLNGASGYPSNGNNGSWATRVSFDASRVVPTAEENRPKNIAFNLVIVK